jgi:hypothetical protein
MIEVPELMEVPAAKVVPEAKVVVVVKLPGAVIAAGRVSVTVLPDPAVVIWLAVPKILIFPAVGLKAPPDDAVIVAISPGVAAITCQVAVLDATSTKM